MPAAACPDVSGRLQIVDAPRFLWRGVLLDCGRHFFPLPFIKKFLDVMALHKLNRFHWHLVEDQACVVPTITFPLASCNSIVQVSATHSMTV
jgi:hexosaminidase